MTTPPSFERFDYQLRSNKHIERKLVFDFLLRAKHQFDFQSYRYLGLGSMWFADHRLAHRFLEIDDLMSIEAPDHAARAKFNRPFGSVTVLPGLTHDVLPKWDAGDWSKPMITWMDYDGKLTPSIASDLEFFANNIKPDSVLLVTVNAVWENYKVKPFAVKEAKTRGRHIDPRSVGTLKTILGNVVPMKYVSPNQQKDVKKEDFPECMAESLLAFINHKVNMSGRQIHGQNLRFVPLFNFCHKDGADMVTVGGAIASPDSKSKWEQLLIDDPMLGTNGISPAHHKLDLIPITLREKLALDSVLPAENADFERLAREKGLEIEPAQAEKYRRYYRHFPMFVESPV